MAVVNVAQQVVDNWTKIIAAVGGLGTAAFGLVDVSKVLWGSVNHIGFNGISRTVTLLTLAPSTGMPQARIIATLEANWCNGTDPASQKAIAKSLIKLHLNASNAKAVAEATGLDAAAFLLLATNLDTGVALTPGQSDLYGRFDLIVTAMLDQVYQEGDHDYRNFTRALAMAFAVVLAYWGGHLVGASWYVSILVGLLATPLAPVAKDLSTALATAVNTMQLIKK
jgi:hypothetical protein